MRKSMSDLKAVILAAGKGTRMESDLPKVVHKVMGKPMIEFVIEAAKEAGAKDICLVVGYRAEQVKAEVTSKVTYAFQAEQLGTGHAVKCAGDFIGRQSEILILCGDTPLITGETLKKLYDYHKTQGNSGTVLSARVDNPDGYGRIIRDENGKFIKNVEHKDATPMERESCEINSGIYLFHGEMLAEALDSLTTDNAQGEYYLPDTLTYLSGHGHKVEAFMLKDPEEIAGVNTKEQLALAEAVMHKKQVRRCIL